MVWFFARASYCGPRSPPSSSSNASGNYGVGWFSLYCNPSLPLLHLTRAHTHVQCPRTGGLNHSDDMPFSLSVSVNLHLHHWIQYLSVKEPSCRNKCYFSDFHDVALHCWHALHVSQQTLDREKAASCVQERERLRVWTVCVFMSAGGPHVAF